MIRKIDYLFLLGFTFLLISCKDNREPEFIPTDAPCFSLSLKEIYQFSANVEVSHTGSNRDRYFVYVDESLAADLDIIVDSLLCCLDHLVEYNQRKRVIPIGNLMPNCLYRIVVFSVDENNYLYGEPNSLCVKTQNVDLDMYIESSWNINWIGETRYNDEYYTQIDVNCDHISEPFYYCLFSDSVMEKFSGNIAQIASYLIEEAHKEVREIGVENFSDLVTCVSIHSYFYRKPGFYYYIVIGVDENGLPSGKYNISEKNQIEDYTMLPGYEQLLGKWRLTDKSGESATINIKADNINRTYKVYGWAKKRYPIILSFEKSKTVSTISINRQIVAKDVSIKGEQEGSSFIAELYLEAWYMNSSGNRKRATTNSPQLATCVAVSSDCYVVKASFYYTDLEESDYGLCYMVVDKGEYDGYLLNTIYTFPIILNRI